MKYSFPKSIRLRTRRQYQRMVHASTRYTGHWIIIDTSPSSLSDTRLGITVTRRFGKAHDRNRFKRIVREAFRLNRGALRAHLDINIKPRSAAIHATMANIQEDLLKFLGQD